MGQLFGVDQVALWALGQDAGPIFGTKIIFFLRYTHKSATFSIGRTQTNGIILCPHPEVTLDTFGFAVLAHLAARRAVFRSQLAKMGLFGA